MTLTYKQRRFVDEFMIDRNATQAALRAGYAEKFARGIGCAMLAHYKVRAEVDRRSVDLSDRAGVAAIQVIEKLWAIVRANIADYLIIDADGQIRLDPSKIKGEQAAPIAALATEGATAGDGAGHARRTHIRMHDKIAAADKLLRHLGGYKDRVEHTGQDGGPIAVAPVTHAQRLKAVMALIAKAEDGADQT